MSTFELMATGLGVAALRYSYLSFYAYLNRPHRPLKNSPSEAS